LWLAVELLTLILLLVPLMGVPTVPGFRRALGRVGRVEPAVGGGRRRGRPSHLRQGAIHPAVPLTGVPTVAASGGRCAEWVGWAHRVKVGIYRFAATRKTGKARARRLIACGGFRDLGAVLRL
jgi:hypothetical protein